MRSGEPRGQTADIVDHERTAVEAEEPHATGVDEQKQADRVIGINIRAKPLETRTQIKRIAEGAAELVAPGRAITDGDIVPDGRYAHPAYGVPAAATHEAIRLSAAGAHAHPIRSTKENRCRA